MRFAANAESNMRGSKMLKSTFLAVAILTSSSFTQEPLRGLDEGAKYLDAAFSRYVRDGLVDYKSILSDRDFNAYLAWLARTGPSAKTPPLEEMAFWVNAYNALAIHGVILASAKPGVNHERFKPISSVMKVKGFFDEQKYEVGGRKYTLNQIEKEILLPKFKDVRLHFVLVCAAMSCPGLPSTAYTSSDIDARMTQVGREFIGETEKNLLDKKNKTLNLSQIFNWYRGDFETGNMSLLDFVAEYLPDSDAKFVCENEIEITFREYDWALNAQN